MIAYILAVLMAISHGLLAVFLVAGAPFAISRPRLAKWYISALIPTAIVNLAGQPCPLTVWENHFWRQAGETPYSSGFISHYFIKPFYAPGLGPHEDVILITLMTIWCSLWLLVAIISRLRLRHGTAH